MGWLVIVVSYPLHGLGPWEETLRRWGYVGGVDEGYHGV